MGGGVKIKNFTLRKSNILPHASGPPLHGEQAVYAHVGHIKWDANYSQGEDFWDLLIQGKYGTRWLPNSLLAIKPSHNYYLDHFKVYDNINTSLYYWHNNEEIRT